MRRTRADVLDNLGIALATRKQFAEAIACFEAALKVNPDSADTHNNFATVLFCENRLDEAIRHYREAFRLTQDNPQIISTSVIPCPVKETAQSGAVLSGGVAAQSR